MTDEELIEAVAVEVMGADIHKKNRFIAYCAVTKRFWIESENGAVVFDPLTNGNHILMVAEKMKADGYDGSLSFSGNLLTQTGKYTAGFSKNDVDSIIIHPKPGHAVCLAALEAVRSPVPVVEE